MESKEHQKKCGKYHIVDLSRMARSLYQLECRYFRLNSRVHRQDKTIRSFAWILFGLIISNFILGLLALESILKGVG